MDIYIADVELSDDVVGRDMINDIWFDSDEELLNWAVSGLSPRSGAFSNPVLSSRMGVAPNATIPKEYERLVQVVGVNVVRHANDELLPELRLERVTPWPKRPAFAL